MKWRLRTKHAPDAFTQLAAALSLSSAPLDSVAPTFVELCAGGGGLSTGLIKAGWQPKLLVEIDSVAVQTLKRNHPTAVVLAADMATISLEEYMPCDMLVAGLPCQSFSSMGKRGGLADPRGQLFIAFADLLRKHAPRQFMIENVKGLVSHNKGETLRTILALLSVDGRYEVKWAVLNANRFGVPQKRERLIIVGREKGMEPFQFPAPLDGVGPTLRDALTECPISAGASYSAAKKAILDLVPAGGCWTSLPEALQREYLGSSYGGPGGMRGTARRLSWDKPCLTIMSTPSQKQTERCHPTETRPLTVRETARVQSFDDSYIFCGTMSQQYRQIGNAVPVKLAQCLGEALMCNVRAFPSLTTIPEEQEDKENKENKGNK